MSWTADVLETKKDQYGLAVTTVRYSDGTTTREVPYRGVVDTDNLKRLVNDQIVAFEKADAAVAGIPVGPFDPKIDPPPPPPEPTAEEVARREFLAAYRKLQALKRAVDSGLLAADSKLFTDALTAAQAAFLPEYIDIL